MIRTRSVRASQENFLLKPNIHLGHVIKEDCKIYFNKVILHILNHKVNLFLVM